MKKVEIAAYGAPEVVAECVEAPDLGAPQAGEILFDVLAFPINPADLSFCRGNYRLTPNLPATPGAECVGRISAVGAGVTDLKPGDLVINMARENWAQRRRVRAQDAVPIPAGLDLKQAAMLRINPATAQLLLEDHVALQPGDWVIQNVANSAVGRHLIVLAKAHGWRTINVVRREDVAAELKAIGGDVVLVDGPDLGKRVSAETGKAPIALAVDGVGDTATTNLLGCLAEKGVHVFYSTISGKPSVVPATHFIFRDISMRGFWLANWFNSATPDQITRMYDRLTPLVASGAISAPIAGTYSFAEVAEAVAVASKNRGKVLFKVG